MGKRVTREKWEVEKQKMVTRQNEYCNLEGFNVKINTGQSASSKVFCMGNLRPGFGNFIVGPGMGKRRVWDFPGGYTS